ncbi:MAG: hypothetical protein EU549_00180 [Promethearchaeota archaeon]|nr:MAG: hypothetical protein EU549_00180 [Candidatus Lokiarchaeota archaeon]
MTNGHNNLERNENRMGEVIKEREKEEEKEDQGLEDRSIEDLENELKKLQRKIDSSSQIVKEKLHDDGEIKTQPKIKSKTIPKPKNIEKISPRVIDEEIRKEKSKEEKLQELWSIYKWAGNPEKYPWMYWMPSKDSESKDWKKNLESWKTDWSKFTIDWARVFILHILDMYEVVKAKPYINLNDREKALNTIFNNLVKMKRGKGQIAEWIDNEKSKIRLYWRSLDEWAKLFYNWAYEGGGDIFTLIDIRNAASEIPGLDTLPEEDIRNMIDILVKQKKARWIDKKLIRVKILFRGLN